MISLKIIDTDVFEIVFVIAFITLVGWMFWSTVFWIVAAVWKLL